LEGNLLPEPNKIKKGKGRICCENGWKMRERIGEKSAKDWERKKYGKSLGESRWWTEHLDLLDLQIFKGITKVITQQLPDSEEAYGAADQPQLQSLSMCTSPLVNLAIT
jgi:hypothetical protein